MRFQSDTPKFLYNGTLQPRQASEYDCDFYVECDGARVQEYDIKKEGKNVMVCYIASERGKEFRLRCDNKMKWWLDVQCSFDGRRVEDRYGCPPLQDSPAFRVCGGKHLTRPFVFASVITAGSGMEWLAPDTTKLGLIELHVWRCARGFIPEDDLDLQSEFDCVDFVHSRIVANPVEASMHCTIFGQPEPIVDKMPIVSMPLDAPNHPFVVFRFHYRPMQMLESMGVVPMPLVQPMPVRPSFPEIVDPFPLFAPFAVPSGSQYQIPQAQYPQDVPVPAPAVQRPSSITSVASGSSHPVQASSGAGSNYAPSDVYSIATQPPSNRPSVVVNPDNHDGDDDDDNDDDDDDDDDNARSIREEIKSLGWQVDNLAADVQAMREQMCRMETMLGRIFSKLPSADLRGRPQSAHS